MRIRSAKTIKISKRAGISHQRIHSDPDTLGNYFMCLDGAWEVWLDLMEEKALSTVHNLDKGSTRPKRLCNHVRA